ncbi:hypothetical protein MPSEU_000054000 [Mayamaea pseudoterrestris]|nr:hypothetical protein MPSEU_000054000 [Mayamaea pseudoterrestris]
MIKLRTAQLHNVELQAVAAPNDGASHFFLQQQHPALVLLQQDELLDVVGGGGNGMVLALSRLNVTSNKCSDLDQAKMEDWLDWERTELRHSSKLSLQVLIEALEHRRKHHHHSSMHCLVGSNVSVADVCIVTTLLNDLQTTDLPEIVSDYVKHHAAAFAAAKQAVAEFDDSVALSSNSVASVDIDMDEPRLSHVLRQVFGAAVRHISNHAITDLATNLVTKCQNPKHGDYQCNAAMSVFATLKQRGITTYSSPQQVAQAMIDAVVAAAGNGETHSVVTDLTVQGPGFIMMKIQPRFLQTHLNQRLNVVRNAPSSNAQQQVMPFPPNIVPQTCVVDFSSPNIAKEMHVGHLRSTIIGESVCRILEAVGHTVHRVNHVGDWGTQFGMLIQYLKELQESTNDNNGSGESHSGAEGASITDLTEFYKKAKQRFDESPGFQKVYERLDVRLNECGESFYNDKIPAVIQEFEQAGMLEAEEGGAKVVRVNNFKVPLMLQKSDGGYGYDSTDAAALKYRLFELKADRIIVITDFTQADHFKMVYGAGRAIGWVKDGNQRLEHIGFGTVQGEDGKRFKTRSGETVRLVDLLDEAVVRMDQSLRERIAEGKAGITVDEVKSVAEAVGYGAVKYYDLRRNPTSNYKFSYDQMLDTKGDTAVYLLYARVRLESIAAKAKAEFNVDIQDLLKSGEEIVIEHPSERNLALNLMAFADMYEKTLEELFPCNICEYVYKLSTAVGDFVTQCKVLGSPEMKSRLLLCHVSTLAMGQCFDLLGIRNVMRI